MTKFYLNKSYNYFVIFCKHRRELLKEQSDQCLYSLPPQGKPYTHLSCPPYLAGE